MWLKSAIAITFVLLFVSLASGFVFLIKDQGKSKRTLYSLGIRIFLAAVLSALIGYGILSGELKSQAPWSVQPDYAPTIEHDSVQTRPVDH